MTYICIDISAPSKQNIAKTYYKLRSLILASGYSYRLPWGYEEKRFATHTDLPRQVRIVFTYILESCGRTYQKWTRYSGATILIKSQYLQPNGLGMCSLWNMCM